MDVHVSCLYVFAHVSICTDGCTCMCVLNVCLSVGTMRTKFVTYV
jgi:hypothetical protein